MIHLKLYQDEAVNTLIQQTYKLLKLKGARHPLIFKAPTGAGKTVMMAEFLNKLCEELPEKLDLEKRKAAFIWIAPNKLYIQSYASIQNYFAETRCIDPIYFESINNDTLQPNQVLFVNWESINKEKNTMIRANEQNKTLYQFVNNAKLNDTEIIVIIDEEHMFANTKTAKRANEVLQKIHPKIEIRVSATPTTNSDYKTIVQRQDVIDQEMIKKGIILNPALDTFEQEGGITLNQTLLKIALQKRQDLAEAYKAIGVKINPLLLVQLPNDISEDITLEDQKYIDTVIQNLEHTYNITVQNNKLAIWLSNKKENLDSITDTENLVEVLLFKQAIALGWDCPRAGVLLIFREMKSTSFTIQTVGRILRMPEQKHYPNALLNQGYVFTNLAKKQIEIVKDDMNYITMNRALRIEDYKPVVLNSSYVNARLIRNRLGAQFKRAMYETIENLWALTRDLDTETYFEKNKSIMQSRFINMDVSTIDIIIPENVNLTGELELKNVDETARFVKTQDELDGMFRQFCKANVGSFAAVDSTPVLEMSLKLFFEEYLNENEFDAIKIMLDSNNQPIFIQMIEKSLETYTQILAEKANAVSREVINYTWEVPAERVYNELYEEQNRPTHALLPYYEYTKASTPEKLFAEFLENNKEHLAWWYKNGESAKEHFAINYIDYLGKESLFYIDFVILTNTGVTCLFDTKTKGSDAANVVNKHNALVEFIASRNEKGMPTIGGVIISKEINGNLMWQYCSNRIQDTNDLTGWDYFNPAEIK
jgi:type III restriction enzyme